MEESSYFIVGQKLKNKRRRVTRRVVMTQNPTVLSHDLTGKHFPVNVLKLLRSTSYRQSNHLVT